MENEEKVFKSELIPLLIKYKENIGTVFPIEKLKYLTTDIIVERLKDCIINNKKYELGLTKFNDKRQSEIKSETENKLISENNLKNIIPLIKLSMNNINYNYEIDCKEIMEIIELRNNGKDFTFSEHLRALIISLLSNHRWGDSNIRNNKYKIDAIFHNYDKNYLKLADPTILVDELKKIHCTNPMIVKQMKSLNHNICVLEQLESEYGSLDNFVTCNDSNDIANWFNEGRYKLKQVGRAFAFDYLKRVGINTCKSSASLERLFGYSRLAIVSNKNATAGQVISIIKQLSNINNIGEVEIESILNQFCLLRSANICGEVPNCERCKLRNLCNYDK